MLFDDKELNPLYKLKVGQPGSSYTFEVARNVGLPENIIEKARAGLKDATVRFEDKFIITSDYLPNCKLLRKN